MQAAVRPGLDTFSSRSRILRGGLSMGNGVDPWHIRGTLESILFRLSRVTGNGGDNGGLEGHLGSYFGRLEG